MSSSTISCFSNLILIENFFCINRAYLIDCPKKRLYANIIFLATLTLLITVIILNIISSDVSIGIRMFQGFLAVELFVLATTAGFQSSFDVLKRLDEKCGIEEEYMEKLVASSSKYTVFVISCAVIDIAGLIVLDMNLNEVIMYFILYSAQDAELIFFSMIEDAINLRLMKLKYASPAFGSKVYRHVLVTTALMNEEVSPRIMLMLAVILGTTVTYFSVIILSFAHTGKHALFYVLWRELKVFFCLWRVCSASSRSESICLELAFELAKKLALDPSVDKVKHHQSHRILSRWSSTVLSERPHIMSGSVLSIGLAVPLHLMDLSFNYALIIIQIYVAYN